MGLNRVPWGVTLIPKGSGSVRFVQVLEGNVTHRKVPGGGISVVLSCLYFGESTPCHSDESTCVKQKTCSASWHPNPNSICQSCKTAKLCLQPCLNLSFVLSLEKWRHGYLALEPSPSGLIPRGLVWPCAPRQLFCREGVEGGRGSHQANQ